MAIFNSYVSSPEGICMDVIINMIITSIIVMADGLWMCWQGHNQRIPFYVDSLNQVVATLGRAFPRQ